uniref:Uncharacterized protein n=1 Tax=Oryza brachyantha TaxID=4533 RepID=J3L1U1_ORYBR
MIQRACQQESLPPREAWEATNVAISSQSLCLRAHRLVSHTNPPCSHMCYLLDLVDGVGGLGWVIVAKEGEMVVVNGVGWSMSPWRDNST